MDVDQFLPTPIWHSPHSSSWNLITKPFWGEYIKTRATEILNTGGTVVDLGGGLRIDDTKSNDATSKLKDVLLPLTKQDGITFITTDYTDKYNPDQVEDVHNLSFEDESIDALFCIAMLEHVYDPKLACAEMMRTLKPGGKIFYYAPWMYLYHAHGSDYYDYFRYSKDGIAYLFKDANHIELCPVRGALETLLYYTPLGSFKPLQWLLRIIDWKLLKNASQRQASGYFAVITK